MKENFADLLNTQFEYVKERKLKAPTQGLAFYVVESTDKDYIKRSYVTGLGLVPENRDVDGMPYDVILPGFDNTVTPTDFRLAVRIEKRLRETDQFGVIGKIMSQLLQAGRDTVEYYAADAFNTGFTSAAKWTCADGMYLFDDGRPQESKGAANWSNLETGAAISAAGIRTMRENFRMNLNSRGLIAPIVMKTLIVPNELEDDAVVFTASKLKPGTALNDDNYNTRHGFTVEVWDYLTSATAWFGMGSKDEKHELFWTWRVKPETTSDLAADNPDVVAYRLRMSFATSADRPHNLRGNAGA